MLSVTTAQNQNKKEKKNLESIGVCDGMGGQGQYRVGRGSIGCSTTQVRFSAYQIRSWPFVFQSEKRMGSLYRRSRRVRKTEKTYAVS